MHVVWISDSKTGALLKQVVALGGEAAFNSTARSPIADNYAVSHLYLAWEGFEHRAWAIVIVGGVTYFCVNFSALLRAVPIDRAEHDRCLATPIDHPPTTR